MTIANLEGILRSKGREYLPKELIMLTRRLRNIGPAPERVATLDDLRACYRLFLDRRPDDRGFRSYASAIKAGRWGVPSKRMTVAELTKLFLASPEFRQRLNAIYESSSGVPELVDLRDGGRLYVSSTDSVVGAAIKRNREYEPHVVSTLRLLLRPGMTFVDVGASCGFFTVLAATTVGPTGQVISFEPGPQNKSILLLNIATHQLKNIQFYPVALSDEDEILLYYTSGGNGAVMPFSGESTDLASGDLVVANRLDDLLHHETAVDVIKIDVEGAEGKVLGGAIETLQRHHPILFFEFSPPSLQATSGRTGRDLLEQLQSYGYSFEVLHPGEKRGGLLGVNEVLQRYESRNSDHLDILAQSQATDTAIPS